MTSTAFPLRGPGGEDWHVPAGAPVAPAGRLPRDAGAGRVSRFSDDTWDLSTLARREHDPGRRINWASFPSVLRGSFKRAGWTLITLPTPEALLERAATSRVEHPSAGTIASVTEQWRRYATWLANRGIARLADVDDACHEEWAAHLARLPAANRTRSQALDAVSRLWGFAPHLPPGDRIPMLPWEADGTRDYLPAEDGRSENATVPVHPAVMSPLLVWALRFTEDFAPDILAALAEQQRLRFRIAAGHSTDAATRLAALLGEHARAGTPLPGETIKGRRSAACSYLAGLTGASLTQARNAVRRARLPVADAAPLDTAITATVHGRPWLSHVSYHQAQALALRLAAACLVVVAYLSGQRPAEVLHLRSGCCPAPDDDGTGTARYRLNGQHFKGVQDADGSPAPGGAPRQWTVIPPVHTAIGILEQLTTSSYLFPLRPAWLEGASPGPRQRPPAPPGTRGSRHRTGQVVTAKAANGRIAEFIAWVNAYAREHGLDSETIPADPDGPVTLSRFRRTVAWHIARLPGGRIALAIQHGHLRTITTSEGYSGRARHGLARVLDIETAATMASYLQRVSDRLNVGEAVSGPAASRLVSAARDAATRYEGMFLSPRQVRALLSDPALQVHDNPTAFLACNYDPAKALCHPGRAAAKTAGHPDLDWCNPACANIARTGEHIEALTAETARLRAEAGSPLAPGPIRQRPTQRADMLEHIAERHARTGITVKADDCG
jgi:hypothetical protein